LVIEPEVENLNLVRWVESNREAIEAELMRHGAILLRGFEMESVARFEQVALAISPELLDYNERAAPRTRVGNNIFTSTEFPSDQSIPLHHEMSYSHHWPSKIWFYCVQPATQGGRTPLASERKVTPLIDAGIKKRFVEKRVMYIRNYGEGVDLTWQEAFQTTDRALVERYCRQTRMEFEWRAGDRLRTRAVRQVVAVHPKSGETLWFNHAHMFHVSNLDQHTHDALLSEFRADELPRNAFYGDGSSIEPSVLEEIRGIYHQASISFLWRKGDLLLLDNFLSTHGREPFVGPRKILVAMAELYTNELT
jgi:alpha-ketoglutarate-dependent taurine dioxygenase